MLFFHNENLQDTNVPIITERQQINDSKYHGSTL